MATPSKVGSFSAKNKFPQPKLDYCPLCGSECTELVYLEYRYAPHKRRKVPFGTVQCRACTWVSKIKTIEELKHLYRRRR